MCLCLCVCVNYYIRKCSTMHNMKNIALSDCIQGFCEATATNNHVSMKREVMHSSYATQMRNCPKNDDFCQEFIHLKRWCLINRYKLHLNNIDFHEFYCFDIKNIRWLIEVKSPKTRSLVAISKLNSYGTQVELDATRMVENRNLCIRKFYTYI